jgi:RNA-directed DNA polymerase
MEVLPERMSKYGLTVHPEKTRLVRFTPSDDDDSTPTARKVSEPRTFDFLGFTHYWARTQQGGWVIKRKTATSRFRRALRAVWEWCQKHLHDPVQAQYRKLRLKLQGHYAYYGIRGNSGRLSAFLRGVHRIWKHWLGRRDNAAPMTWADYNRLCRRYPLPNARIVHRC